METAYKYLSPGINLVVIEVIQRRNTKGLSRSGIGKNFFSETQGGAGAMCVVGILTGLLRFLACLLGKY